MDFPARNIRFSVKTEAGSSWSSPATASALYPRVGVAQNSDRLQILWVGFSRGGDSIPWDWPPGDINTVWSAELLPGGISTPKVLYTALNVSWIDALRSRIVGGSGGRLVMMFGAIGQRGPEVVLARFRDGTWSTRALKVGFRTAYISVGVIGDTIIAGLIGVGPGADVNSVYVMSSRDFGSTWSAPRIVSELRGREAHFLNVAVYDGHFFSFGRSLGSLSSRVGAFAPWGRTAMVIESLCTSMPR